MQKLKMLKTRRIAKDIDQNVKEVKKEVTEMKAAIKGQYTFLSFLYI